MRASWTRRILTATLLGVIAGAISPASVRAENEVVPPPAPATAATAAPAKKLAEPSKPLDTANAPSLKSMQTTLFKAVVRALVEKETRNTGLPADVADAVVRVESDYNPYTIGSVGEIGLMQIRPETAAMLGFRGSAEELAKPETNIHYGVIYLSKAWRLADGDLCRTLMKYRAGHGEEVMTPRSLRYCDRARSHLAALGSPLAAGAAPPAIIPSSVLANIQSKPVLISPKDVYAQYRQGTPAASRAYWAAHEARIRAIKARIESRWHRMASR